MNVTTKTSHLSYRLLDHREMSQCENAVTVTSPFLQMTISQLNPDLCQILMALTKRPCSVRWFNKSIIAAQGEDALAPFYRYISCLLRHQMLCVCAGNEKRGTPLATLIPISSSFKHQWAHIQDNQVYRISRFAYTRRYEDGYTYMESPLAHARLRLEHTVAATIIYHLGKAMTAHELIQTLPEADEDDVASVLALLVMGNFAFPTTSEKPEGEDEDDTLLQWEFHDLLFHSRSRKGRHDNMLGGTYRFEDHLPPQPMIKQGQWPVTIPLPRPDMERIRRTDPSLTDVMEARTSLRSHGTKAITLEQIGEFLYRVARVKEHNSTEETGAFTTRPYPSAGASYEIECYLTINQCEGLMPGFYWYDPMQHELALIHEMNKDTVRLLTDAQQSTGAADPPQVLITLAARFQRVAWKYQGIAYSLILKNVGVMFATMYLVATAMNLAACALGSGDADHFTQVAGTNYLEETSVGEFTLGSLPDDAL